MKELVYWKIIYLYNMDLKAVQENLSKLNFAAEQQNAILHLIDIKIEDDMEKVLNKIDTKFDAVNSELRRLEDKQDTKFTMIMWALGILIALMLALKFIH